MKKLSLLLGTLGGATAGYLFSNKKLRDQLSGAKDAEEAARILGVALQRGVAHIFAHGFGADLMQEHLEPCVELADLALV